MKPTKFPLPSGFKKIDCERFFNSLYEEAKFYNAKTIIIDGEALSPSARYVITYHNKPKKGPTPRMQMIWSKSENRYILGPPLPEGDYGDHDYNAFLFDKDTKIESEGNPDRQLLVDFELQRIEKFVLAIDKLHSFKIHREYKKYLEKLDLNPPKGWKRVHEVLASYFLLNRDEIDSPQKILDKIETLKNSDIFPSNFTDRITDQTGIRVHKLVNNRIAKNGRLKWSVPDEFERAIKDNINYEYAKLYYLRLNPGAWHLFDLKIDIDKLKKNDIILRRQGKNWLRTRIIDKTTNEVLLKSLEGKFKGKEARLPISQLSNSDHYRAEDNNF